MNRRVLALASVLFGLGAAVWLVFVLTAHERGSQERASVIPRSDEPALPEVAQLAARPERGDERQAQSTPRSFVLTGQVRSATGELAAGAHVEAWWVSSESSTTHLGRAHADEAGRYRIEATTDALEPSVARSRSLRVSASAPGHGSTLVAPRIDASQPKLLELDLVLGPGAVLTGRTVDEQGEPISGARVALYLERASPRQIGVTRSASDGSFALRTLETGKFRVVASRAGIGSAARGGLEPGFGAQELGELVLLGPGRLVGTLRNADGEPVPELQLLALPAELSGQEPDLPRRNDWRLEHEGGDGMTFASAFSAGDGSFALEGIRHGAYTIRPVQRGLKLEFPDRRYVTGQTGIELVLATRFLTVRVLDAQGSALEGIPVHCGAIEPRADGPRLGESVEELSDADGRTEFFLRPDLPHIGLFASHPLHGSAELELRPTRARQELDLVLAAAGEPASLRLRLRGEPEEVLPWFRVELYAERTGALAVTYRILPRSDELEASLPPGRYRARLIPEPTPLGAGAPAYLPLTAPEPIVLIADEEALIQLAPRYGGRIELHLPTDGEKPVDKQGPWHFELDDGANPPRALHFVETRFAQERRRRPADALHRGETGWSEALEPGLYTLRRASDGPAQDARPVSIGARGLARVEWD